MSPSPWSFLSYGARVYRYWHTTAARCRIDEARPFRRPSLATRSSVRGLWRRDYAGSRKNSEKFGNSHPNAPVRVWSLPRRSSEAPSAAGRPARAPNRQGFRYPAGAARMPWRDPNQGRADRAAVCGGETMQEAGKTRKNSETVTRTLLYEFGPFRVDPQKRLLLQDGQPVPLTGKAFDILLALLECHGEILTKDEMIGRVWPDTVVEEGNLGRNISSLRKALDESPDEHRYIVTLARRGYRFVADVRERWEENGIAAGPAEIRPFPAPDPGALPSVGTPPGRRLRWSMVV